jgi:hypothetical protein
MNELSIVLSTHVLVLSGTLSLQLGPQLLENVAPMLKQLLPSLYRFTLVRQSLSPYVHLRPRLLLILPWEVNNQTHTFLGLQDLLSQNIVLILDGVHIAWQVVFQLLDSQVTRLCVVVVKLLLDFSVEILSGHIPIVGLVAAWELVDLITQDVDLVHVVSDSLD